MFSVISSECLQASKHVVFYGIKKTVLAASQLFISLAQPLLLVAILSWATTTQDSAPLHSTRKKKKQRRPLGS